MTNNTRRILMSMYMYVGTLAYYDYSRKSVIFFSQFFFTVILWYCKLYFSLTTIKYLNILSSERKKSEIHQSKFHLINTTSSCLNMLKSQYKSKHSRCLGNLCNKEAIKVLIFFSSKLMHNLWVAAAELTKLKKNSEFHFICM